MSSKKTSKTIPKLNAKRYITFLKNIYSAEYPSLCFIGAFSTKEELNNSIKNAIDKDTEDYEVEVYDVVNNAWTTLTIETDIVRVNWPSKKVSNN